MFCRVFCLCVLFVDFCFCYLFLRPGFGLMVNISFDSSFSSAIKSREGDEFHSGEECFFVKRFFIAAAYDPHDNSLSANESEQRTISTGLTCRGSCLSLIRTNAGNRKTSLCFRFYCCRSFVAVGSRKFAAVIIQSVTLCVKRFRILPTDRNFLPRRLKAISICARPWRVSLFSNDSRSRRRSPRRWC